MAARTALVFTHEFKKYKTTIGTTVFLFLILPFSQGSDVPVSSSQQMSQLFIDKNISVSVSELMRDARTISEDLANKVVGDKTENEIIITPTEIAGGSSSIDVSLSENSEDTRGNAIQKSDFLDTLASKSLGVSDEYYNALKPTIAGKIKEAIISKTETAFPGEAGGVSMIQSRPRQMPEKKNYSEAGESRSKKFYADGTSKYLDKHRLGKNFEQVEKTLGKIAQIALDDKVPQINRTSRDEENRKASPDIQDIITGIVKILNGKTTTEGSTTRPPRPTGTRINNRGPPRISDVPPLDFDGPPSIVPLPPPPPRRAPPPYPFDIPPSMPNIPLPPQPIKPGHSSLPSHPFIDGVPIPEIVVPGKTPEIKYDTISASVHQTQDNSNFPSLTIPGKPLKNVTSDNFIPLQYHSGNDSRPEVKNPTPKPDFIKNKAPPQKGTTANFHNKTGNKRIRPRPTRPFNGTRVVPKPIQMKNVTLILTSNKNVSETLGSVTKELEMITRATEDNETFAGEQTTPEPPPPITDNPVEETETGANSSIREPPPEETSPESVFGIGEATPVLESSVPEMPPEIIITTTPVLNSTSAGETTQEYPVRPGIVLDDPEFKPMGHKKMSLRPIITAPPLPHPPPSHYGEIFDITVHAVQGPGSEKTSAPAKPFIYPVDVNGGVIVQNSRIPNGEVSVITKPEEGQDFVSIDGKRTYINLFGESTSRPVPTPTQPSAVAATGYPVPHKEVPLVSSRPVLATPPPRRSYKRPSHPPVRIDTCIVGDDNTCDSAQNEMCRTEDGVSSCHCRPGYNRRKHRDTCRRVVSMITSLRVDKLYDRKVKWQDAFTDPDSEEYQQLTYEASQAIESAMSMTPFSDDYMNSKINSIYPGRNAETSEPAVYINMTIQLEENLDTVRPAVKHDIQRHLLRVIERRNNNVGNSAIWVNSLPGSILALQDVDECTSAELHDCHQRAICFNTFGSFKCQCPEGSRDPWLGNIHRQGRHCEICSSEYCNNRGECRFEQGQQICQCGGSFYGAQCEVDGEVLGVAIGASVAAAIIIVLTLVCLCMWSRKWSREHKSAVGAGMGSPVFGYMATGPTVKTPNVGGPPYQVSIEDRIRWAQIADVMAQANHYAPEPGNCGTRTSFAGYPTLPAHGPHTMSTTGTLPLSTVTPPVPLPRLSLPNKAPLAGYGGFSQHGSVHQKSAGMRTTLDTTSSSEEEDRADLLGRHFNAPRPKSRTSIANQSGIYYDVDYDRSDIYSKQNTIPMNTYTLNPQHQVRSFFR